MLYDLSYIQNVKKKNPHRYREYIGGCRGFLNYFFNRIIYNKKYDTFYPFQKYFQKENSTKSFSSLEATSSTVPRLENQFLPHLLLTAAFSPSNQGTVPECIERCRAHPTTLPTVALKKRTQLVAFLSCREKLVASLDQDIQCTFLSDQSPHTTNHIGPGSSLAFLPCREANSQPQIIMTRPPSHEHHLISLTRELRKLMNEPIYSLIWVWNQASSPIQLFSGSGTLTLNFKHDHLTHPKIDIVVDPIRSRTLQLNIFRTKTEQTVGELSLTKKTCKVWKMRPLRCSNNNITNQGS